MQSLITKISIGRVYNLGNYEHIRYEITADVPPECSASEALHGLETLIKGLNPARPSNVLDNGDLARLATEVDRLRAMDDDEYHKTYFSHLDKKIMVDKMASDLEKKKALAEKWKKRCNSIRVLFDDLGGAAIYKDAKENWDNDDFQF